MKVCFSSFFYARCFNSFSAWATPEPGLFNHHPSFLSSLLATRSKRLQPFSVLFFFFVEKNTGVTRTAALSTGTHVRDTRREVSNRGARLPRRRSLRRAAKPTSLPLLQGSQSVQTIFAHFLFTQKGLQADAGRRVVL